MNPDQTAPKSNRGLYCLQCSQITEVHKKMREQKTIVMNSGRRVKQNAKFILCSNCDWHFNSLPTE